MKGRQGFQRIPLAERFAKHTRREGDCIVWAGHLLSGGYGQTSINGTTHGVHRIAYEMAKGPIPEGLVIDHLCRNRACVNPEHLEAVTHRENVLRGVGFPAVNAAKTHCTRGHPFSGDNLRFRGNSRERRCAECGRQYRREARARKKAARVGC